jgi:hypothetical protein
MLLKWLVAAVLLFGGFLALLYVAQRLASIFSRASAHGSLGS